MCSEPRQSGRTSQEADGEQALQDVNLGIGVGLRIAHYPEILGKWPAVDWFEIISENFMVDGGRPLEVLHQIIERYPVVQHGVNLAIGSPDPLDWDYLHRLKKLTKITRTPWLSDHLCWGRLPGAHYHDLLPLPQTEEAITRVVERARIIQDFLEIPFALENLSSYATFVEDEMPEWEFYSRICVEADIKMMLDVNNIYVSARNHGFDPHEYLAHVPMERVIQVHLAGHTDRGTHLLDTHDRPVADPVWELYGEVHAMTGGVSTLLEWDDNFVSFDETLKEAHRAKGYLGVAAH